MENVKAQNGDWDKNFSGQKKTENKSDTKGKRAAYMDLSKEGVYKVRLVGKYIVYYRRWAPAVTETHTTHIDYKDKDPFWVAKFPTPPRFAIRMIDRNEKDLQLKILDKGSGVFEHFATYKRLFGIDPAGKDGPDFIIEVKIPKKADGTPDKLSTEYTVTHADKAPFTDAEKEMIKRDIQTISLEDIYKPDPLEKIVEIWNKTPESKRIPPKRNDNKQSNKEAPKKEEKKVEDKTQGDNDDLFEKKDSDKSAETSESGELF